MKWVIRKYQFIRDNDAFIEIDPWEHLGSEMMVAWDRDLSRFQHLINLATRLIVYKRACQVVLEGLRTASRNRVARRPVERRQKIVDWRLAAT